MTKYNHAFDFAAEVTSFDEQGNDITAKQMRDAIIERANRLSDKEILEACSIYDTYEEEQA